MFSSLGRIAYHRRWWVLVAGLLFVVVSGVSSLNLSQSLKIGGFIDPNSESVTAAETAQRQLGREQGQLVILFTSKDGTTADQPQYKQDVEAVLARIAGQPGVGSIFNFYNTGLAQFISKDKKSTYAVVGLPGDDDAQFKTVEHIRPLSNNTSLLQVRVGGRPAVNEEIVKQAEKDLMQAELMTFPIVGILLFLIFRSAVAAFLPLLIGGTAILGAYLILRITTNFTGVSVFALNIITMLGLGLSIDYSLFVVSRFREELKMYNGEVGPALVRTMQTAGHTVFFSGMTVIISLLSLLVFEPFFLKSMGFGGASAVLVAMIASMTILPAILAVLGPRVNLLSINSLFAGRRKAPAGEMPVKHDTGYWYRISQFVMRRPVMVLILTLIPLLWVGLPFLRINFSTFDARTLPDTHSSRQVSDILFSQFPRNETAPIEIVVGSTSKVLEPAILGSLFDYTRQLQALPGVRRVDSLVTVDPNLDKAAYAAFYSEASRSQNALAAQLAQRFARDRFTIINVVYDADQYSNATQDLVRQIRRLPAPPGIGAQVGGATASLVDLLSSLSKSLPLAFGLIVSVLFVLLYLMLGSLVVPLKAVILNILSLSACFGTLVWVFQDGNLADLLGFTATGAIDSTQPVLVFAGAFGLSLDYEVFLLSRIKEHYDRTNDLRASVALGVQKTGGIITSAALLLVVVIGSFVTGEVLFIKQIGLGLAVAILVDATIVRTLLLPASMRLMGKYNWWAPAPLVKLHHKLGLAEKEEEHDLEPLVAPVPVAVSATPARMPQTASPGAAAKASQAPASRPPLGVPGMIEIPAPFGGNGKVAAGASLPNGGSDIDKETLLTFLRKELAAAPGKQTQVNTLVQQLTQVAELCQSMGREKEAAEYYERCLKLMREAGYGEQNQVIVLTQLSNLYQEQQDPENGLRIGHDGLRLSRLTGQAAAEFTFLANLADLYLKRMELKQARGYAWQAFQLAQRRSDAARLRRAERLLAWVEAREEMQYAAQNTNSFLSFTGSFKSMTSGIRPRPAQIPVTPPNAGEQAEALYARAKRLQNERDFYQAIEVYRQALELNPRMVKAHVNRAAAYNAIKEYEQALVNYNKAIELEKNDPDIWFNRGNTYYRRKDYYRALEDYNQAIRLNPNDPDPYFNRAGVYRLLDQKQMAAADFRKVIELSPDLDAPGVKQARNILAKMGEVVHK